MAFQKLALLAAVALLALAGSPADARMAAFEPTHHTLETRLATGWASVDGFGGLGECWGAMLELRSCTNEVVLFFLNGEGYMGQECCRAIRVITHQCWPSMLTSLGFTAEEGDILADYCAVEAATAPPPPPAPAPAHLGRPL